MRAPGGLVAVLLAASGCEQHFMIEIAPTDPAFARVELYLGLDRCEGAECMTALIPGVGLPSGTAIYFHDNVTPFGASGTGPIRLELRASEAGDQIPLAIAVGFDANNQVVGSARLVELDLTESVVHRIALVPRDVSGHRLWLARQPSEPRAACVVREAAPNTFEMIAPAGDVDCDGIDVSLDLCPTVYDPAQRDFDGDGATDACDPCPHRAGGPSADNPDQDDDGDGVGNGCDPSPAVPGDRRVLWSGFYGAGDLDGWNRISGMWAAGAGGLAQTSLVSAAELERTFDLTSTFMQTRFEVISQGLQVSTEIGVCAAIQPATAQRICCDVLLRAGGEKVVETWWLDNQMGGAVSTSQTWLGTFREGSVIELDHKLQPGQSYCTARQPSTNVVVPTSQAVTDDVSGGIGLYMEQATARFHYLFVVDSP